MPAHLKKKDIISFSILVAFCLYLFRDIVIGGHRLFGDDFLFIILGFKKFLYDEIQLHHSIPFWNPYIFSGIPFWAHFESTIFYPLGFLFWLLPPAKAYGYTVFIHLALAGIFMYMLLRSFAINRPGAFIGGAIFMCNGYIMAILYMGHSSPVQSYIWLPIVIYFLRQALISEKPYLHSTIAGILWGIQILAGAPQDAFYTFLASLLFLVCNIKKEVIRKDNLIKFINIALLLFVIGTCLASIQIVPAFEFIGESVRASLDDYALVTHSSYPPHGVITTIMPNFFGSYVANNYWIDNMPWRNLYVGILPVILLFFIFRRHSDNKRLVLFAGSLALISLILAMGRFTPIYHIAYLLPGFDRFRAPSKIIVLWVFALGLLSGKGINDLLNIKKNLFYRRFLICLCFVIFVVVLDLMFHFEKSIVVKFFSPFIPDEIVQNRIAFVTKIILTEFHRFTLLSVAITFFIFLIIRGAIKPTLGAISLGIILLIDLGIVTAGSVKYDDHIYASLDKIKLQLDHSLGKDTSVYRVGSYDSGFGPNIEMYLGYQTVGGYTSLFTDRYYEYINQYKYYKRQVPKGWIVFFYEDHENKRLMDLLNVKYEISYLTKKYEFRKTYYPRAFIVPNYKVLQKEEILDYLIRPDYDPTKIILIEKDDQQTVFSDSSPKTSMTPGKALVTSYRPDQTTIKTESSRPGYLFLSEMFYPGWKAFVDDRPKRVFRCNYLFRMIELPEGHHVVRFVFDPLSIKVGIGITIFTLFMCIMIFIYHLGNKGSMRAGTPLDNSPDNCH